ncbi:hypothetical protein BsWGS_27537 [Bradybaena similaris]
MTVCGLKSMLVVVVAVLTVKNDVDGFKFPDRFQNRENVVESVESRFEDVKEKVEDAVLDRAPAEFVKKWTRLSPAVKHMAVNLPLTHILPQENKQTVQSSPKVKDIGFSWKSCGPADQLVDIRNLTIAPSPLYFPGRLSFGFDIVFHDSIPQNAKVSANLLLEYSARTGTWVKIPCVGQLGSCVYDDVCSLSQAIDCPDELKQRGIPCTCPIGKGEYVLPNFDVDVAASVFISGDYRGTATFTDSSKGQIACYVVTFTVG